MNNIEKIVDILERGQQPSRSECSFFVNQVFSGGVDKDVITKILKSILDIFENSKIEKSKFKV